MHKILFETAKSAIERLFSDRSVDRTVMLVSMKKLLNFIGIMIEALETDIRRDKK